MFPLAACRPKGASNLEVSLLGNVIGVGEKTWTQVNGTALHMQKFTAVAGTLTNIRLKSGAAVVRNAKVAIYADNAGAPGALLGNSVSTPISPGWNLIPLVAYVSLSASSYWLASVCDANDATLRKASGGTERYVAMTYTDPFPDPPSGLSVLELDQAIAGWGWAT